MKEKNGTIYSVIHNDVLAVRCFRADNSQCFLGLKESIIELRKLKLNSLFDENMDTE